MQQTLVKLKAALAAAPAHIVITTHQGPDGDAMGSSLALLKFLRKQGHKVSIISPNDYPEFLHWLPGNEEVVNFMRQKPQAEQLLAEAEYIFHLDYNTIKRSADMVHLLARSQAVRVMIDHHLAPDMPVRYRFSDPTASSTCELLFSLMENWDKSLIDTEIASCIYTGIMTDTGSFCYASATATTFMMAARLLAYGIDRSKIYDRVYDNFSAERMRLMGYCLNQKMELFPEYGAALIALNLQEQQRYSFAVGDSEGFVNLPLSVKGVHLSAFFLEKEDKIKISFRSKGSFSVNELARTHFKGGGHVNAAGGDLKVPLNEAVQLFRDILPQYAERLQA